MKPANSTTLLLLFQSVAAIASTERAHSNDSAGNICTPEYPGPTKWPINREYASVYTWETIVYTVTVTENDGPPQTTTTTKAKAPTTCPPSSVETWTRFCPYNRDCSRCTETHTITQKFDCDCVGREDGDTISDYREKCPEDCSCTTFTQYVPAEGCTATPVLITAVV
ncbi:hypothetical protein TWF281_003007 [Arthrobotrys megalospora]